MYRLISTERVPAGFYKQQVKTQNGNEIFRYYGIRFALVWPTSKSPGYFCGGGSEVFDEQLTPNAGEVIRVTVEHEHQGLGLDSFFDTLTDYMTAHLAEVCYCDLTKEDFRETIYSYLDRRGLRNINVQQAPYNDFVLRIGKVKNYDEAGNLEIEKGSPLYGDLQGISRMDLQSEPEIRFFRLNALSMLVAGFSKFSTKPILSQRFMRGCGPVRLGGAWML